MLKKALLRIAAGLVIWSLFFVVYNWMIGVAVLVYLGMHWANWFFEQRRKAPVITAVGVFLFVPLVFYGLLYLAQLVVVFFYMQPMLL